MSHLVREVSEITAVQSDTNTFIADIVKCQSHRTKVGYSTPATQRVCSGLQLFSNSIKRRGQLSTPYENYTLLGLNKTGHIHIDVTFKFRKISVNANK